MERCQLTFPAHFPKYLNTLLQVCQSHWKGRAFGSVSTSSMTSIVARLRGFAVKEEGCGDGDVLSVNVEYMSRSSER